MGIENKSNGWRERLGSVVGMFVVVLAIKWINPNAKFGLFPRSNTPPSPVVTPKPAPSGRSHGTVVISDQTTQNQGNVMIRDLLMRAQNKRLDKAGSEKSSSLIPTASPSGTPLDISRWLDRK